MRVGPLAEIAAGFSRAAGAAVLLVDRAVAAALPRAVATLVAASGAARVREVEGGEAAKSLAACERLWGFFAEAGLDRRGRVVVLGGGATLDAAGFAAATWHRGAPTWFAPTTLTAQVDAALGGKTALNFVGAKNQIGVVRQPEVLLVDPSLVATSPEDERRSGLGEIAKTALIAGGGTYARVALRAEELRRGEEAALAEAVALALREKARLVEADPEDDRGVRVALNAGHTLGHVLEAASAARGRPLAHGLCVAIGLALETRLVRGGAADAVASLLEALGLPTRAPFAVPFEEALVLLRRDKKSAGDDVAGVPAIFAPGDVRVVATPLTDAARVLASCG